MDIHGQISRMFENRAIRRLDVLGCHDPWSWCTHGEAISCGFPIPLVGMPTSNKAESRAFRLHGPKGGCGLNHL